MRIGRLSVCLLGLLGGACGGASRGSEPGVTSGAAAGESAISGDMGGGGAAQTEPEPEPETTTATTGLVQLAASDGSMVAIGNSGTITWAGDDLRGSQPGDAVIFAAVDGGPWNEVLREPDVHLALVAAGNGHFAALGSRLSSSTSQVILYVSDDTLNWMDVALPNPRVNTLVFGNGIFVASAWEAGVLGHVYVSSDARTWEETSSASFKTLNFGAGRFVGTNGQTIVASKDGRDWQPVPHQLNDIEDVAVVADTFVAVTSYDCCKGDRGYTYQLATSPDGLTWTQQTLEGSGAFSVWAPAGCVGVTLSTSILYLGSGPSCASANYYLSHAGSMIIVDERAYAIHADDHLATSIVTSTDALNWTTLLE